MTKRMVGSVCVAALLAGAGMPASAQNNQSTNTQKPARVASQAASSTGSMATAAQPPATTPADATVLTPTKIRISAVHGRVRYRYGQGEDAVKTLAKVGDTLEEGAIISVATFSAITIRVGDGQDLTLDQLGSAVITTAVNDGKTDITRIKITEGRVSFDVNKVRYNNNVVIEAPDMTLAITGTSGMIQCTAGQPTLAIGADDNRGRIELNYRMTGNRVVMTRNERSDTAVPDPAFRRAIAANVETPTEGARETDELKIVKRAEGSAHSVTLDVGDINGAPRAIFVDGLFPPPGGGTVIPIGIPPGPQSSIHLDSTSGDLYQTSPSMESSLIRQGLAFDPSATDGGAAIVADPQTGFRHFISVASTGIGGFAKNGFTTLALESPITTTMDLGNISGPGVPLIRGLGAGRENLYASGRLDGADAIYKVDLSKMAMEQVMSPGLTLEGGLGGLSQRGTLVAFARDPGALMGSTLLKSGAIIEMDPRNNYLAAVYPGLNGSLSDGGGASNPSGVNLNAIHSITGLSADASSITMSTVVATGIGQTALLRYDTTGGYPRLTDVRLAPERFTTGLASETTGHPFPPVTLRDPTGPIDMVALNERFAMMAYSQQALSSGLVERALRAEILNHASQPQECDGSGAMNALPAILMRHVDERGGIGRAVSDFRVQLAPLHPCRPSGDMN